MEKRVNVYDLVWVGRYGIREGRSVLEKGKWKDFPLHVSLTPSNFSKADVLPDSISNLCPISLRFLSLLPILSHPFSSRGQSFYPGSDNGPEVYSLMILLILTISSQKKIIYKWQLLLQFYIYKTWATKNEMDLLRVTQKMEVPRWEWMKPHNWILR